MKIKKLLSPKQVCLALLRMTAKWWNDKFYLQVKYFISMHSIPNFDDPKTYQEKLNWLKLNYRPKGQEIFVDKYEVKKYIEEKLGKEYVVPCYGVWSSFEEIDFDKLPDQFVLKCTHDSGSYCICRDKKNFDIKKARKRINKGLRRDYYYNSREWPYRYCKHRIVAEMLLSPSNGGELKDYKFFCFNGTPKFMYVSNDITNHARTDFFDMDYNNLDMRMKDKNSKVLPPKPKMFEKMKALSTKLCEGFPHVRVDFYIVDDNIYFGELTFYHNGGFQPIYPKKWNVVLGDWIKLPQKINPYN